MKYALLALSSLLLLTTCVDRIDLDESLSGDPLLVVDGVITDANEPYTVKLSYSSRNLKTYEGGILSGAEVYITDEENNRADLTETGSLGEYQTDSTQFRGKPGKTYQLHIVAPNGKTYASLPETMLPVAPVERVYFEVESRPKVSALGTITDEWGLQFYVNTSGSDNGTAYYRWKWIDTFQFSAPLALPMQLGTPTCYQSSTSGRELSLASTQGLSSNRVERQKLNFVLKTGRKLHTRYSLLVLQYSLTERAYTFWENVRAQQEDAGSVFSPPPAPISGNMYNANDDQEVVLGYFQASAISQQRIFLTRSQVPESPGGNPGGFSECNSTEPSDYCYDCSLIPGTTTVAPSFW